MRHLSSAVFYELAHLIAFSLLCDILEFMPKIGVMVSTYRMWRQVNDSNDAVRASPHPTALLCCAEHDEARQLRLMRQLTSWRCHGQPLRVSARNQAGHR